MGVVSGVNTVTDGLIFYVDPTNTNTYSGVGTTAYNLIPGGINNFSLNNGLSYDLDKSGSFYFDGSNDYVGLGSTTIFNSTTFTVSFWIKPTTYSGTYCSGAVSNGQYTLFGTTSSYQGYSSTFSGAIQFGSSNNCIATVNQSNFSINKWYHYVAVYDSAGTGNSTKFKIYIDGVIKSLTFDATMPSSPYAAGQEARIGWGPGGGAYPYYNGNIGLVQIHSRALSSTEIVQNYNATKARFNTTENIITNGLIYNIDASKNASYPGIGTTIYDLSGIGNTGTLTNGPTFSSQNSGSIVFDGTNDFINLPNTNLLTFGTNPFSIEFWMYSTYIYPGSGAIYKTILSNYNDYNGDFQGYFYLALFNLQNSTLQNKVGVLDHTGNFLDFSFSVPIVPYQWTHIVLTRNGSSFTWYKNGTLQISSSVASNNFSGVRTSKIGGGVSSIGYFTGSLPLMRIYNTTLTATEIQQNYNATKSRYINLLPPVTDSSLVLNLDAGNRASYAGTGTTWTDLSSNGLRASLINGPVFAGTGISTYFSFDGSNDYVDIPSSLSVNASSFTYEVVFRITTGADGNTLLNLNYTFPNSGYIVRQTTGNNLIIYSDNGAETSISSTGTISNNTTYHLTVVQSGGSCSIYFNGTLDKTASLANPVLTTSNATYLGRRGAPSFGAQLLGNIYLTKLYNRALTASEVLQNFNSVRSRYNI
jgi:hypothetical protein